MKAKIKFLAMFALVATMGVFSAKAGDSIKVTADIVSSYVWRGVYSGTDPSFQPTLSYLNGGLEIGVWGSTNFKGTYKEADLYVSYTFKSLKVTLTDYNWTFGKSYFNYTDSITDHIFEVSLAYTFPETFPLTISANTMVYGADKKFDMKTGTYDIKKQAYSTYVELSYPYKNASFFLGITPADGYYGDGYGNGDSFGGNAEFGVCNVGVAATRNIKITDSFSLPVKATLGFNPQKEDAYLVFGITF